MIEFIIDQREKKKISGDILRCLPEWFGIQESTEEYIRTSAVLPFWAVCIRGEPAGFLAMKETGPAAAEIYVMGIRKSISIPGWGARSGRRAGSMRGNMDTGYMQVKTVKRGCYEIYDRTNDFYRAIGFEELECFPDLWDQWNPCQVYIQYIGD